MSLLRDTGLSAVSSIAGTGVRFLVTIMLARILAPNGYGQFVFLQWAIDVSALICSFGIPGVMTRFLPQLMSAKAGEGRPFIRRMLASAAVSSLLSIASFLAFVSFDRRFSAVPVGALALWSLSSVFLSYLSAGLQGLFRYDAVLAGNLAFAAAAPVMTLLLVRQGDPGSAALTMAIALSIGSAAALARWRLVSPAGTQTTSQKPVNARAIWTYAGNLWVSGLLAGLVWSRGELGLLHGHNREIALYASALTLCGLMNQGASLLTGAITPHFVRRWASDDSSALADILLGVTALGFVGVSGLSLVLITFGNEVVRLLYGQAYLGTYPVLCLLAATGISVTCGCSHLVLQLETNAKFGLLTDTLGLVILLGVGAALSPWLGMAGVALGRALSQVLVAGLTFWQVRRVRSLTSASDRLLIGWALLVSINGLAALGFWHFRPPLPAGAAIGAAILASEVLIVRYVVRANPLILLRAP